MKPVYKNENIKPLKFAGYEVLPGESKRIEMPVSKQLIQGVVSIPIHVVYGKNPGPTICLTATLHGDEICGIEIIRQVLSQIQSNKKIHGTIIFVPVVNVFGFINNSRYLPDRRDLNRSFPGSKRGSMASQLANLYFTEIIEKCDYAIDFHTAAIGRINYPQVRANLDNPEILKFAKTLNAPVMIHSKEIKGSLRETAQRANCKMIVFESGEVNRFDPASIKVAVQGIFHSFQTLRLIKTKHKVKPVHSKIFKSMKWIRASKSGLFHSSFTLGSNVKDKEVIGEISNIFGDHIATVKSSGDGMIVGITTNPKVHQGDALIHLACFGA